MKILNKTIVLLLTLALLAPTLASAKKGNSSRVNNRQPVAELSADQADTLLWMREEEKLARDVYLALGEEWGQAIFNNIAASEQNHMDALLKKIDSFGLTDPVLANKPGKFTNEEIQNLYDYLIDQGKKSYIEALRVGVTIEDMDIADLMQAIDELDNTDNLALQTTYESLLEGSKNHLRSFVGLLDQQGEEYDIIYIDEALFKAIIEF